MNKKKIINDPVYGFITIPSDLLFDLIEHPYFQRLRRIQQMGLASLVYPGAQHTRFHHALGAMHLMGVALHTLRQKGHDIAEAELDAAQAAILLHDIGHGPFSHVLEDTLLAGVAHERLSRLFIEQLNADMGGALDLALRIFTNTYERPFFHQLVASQLDTDRLDYLKRDSYFTGVTEGNVGASRLLKMLEIRDQELVIEEKAIYSIESFLNARRVMYWQAYLHKGGVSAEQLLVQIIRRARHLYRQGADLFATPALLFFLRQAITADQLGTRPEVLTYFAQLDDHDIWASVKVWRHHPDPLLAFLSSSLLDRRLFRIHLSQQPVAPARRDGLARQIVQHYDFGADTLDYLLLSGTVSNAAYLPHAQTIRVLTKSGQIIEAADASDLPHIQSMSTVVRKCFLCWPKALHLPD